MRRRALAVAEKKTVSFDVNSYGVYLLFAQWAGAKFFAIYYISCANSLISKIASDGAPWIVSLSDDKTKLSISNENTNNQWASYYLLRID